MKEIQQIVAAYERALKEGKQMALATVVRVQGSAYRREGARMLMTEDGHWTGAISGGCLEGDALRRARKAILEQKPTVIVYDTMEDDSAQSLGVGLGCNGIIDVLIEPMGNNGTNPHIEMLKSFLRYNQQTKLATVYRSPISNDPMVGSQLMMGADGEVSGSLLRENIANLVEEDLANASVSQSKTYGEIDVFLEILHPAIRLVIFGGGYDAMPLTRLAREIGWHVTVTDDCMAKALPVRFPEAHEVKHILREEVSHQVTITPYTAVVLMSHNYKYDLAVLEQLINDPPPYIGILGPRKRFEKMKVALEAQGKSLSDLPIHSPVGLDIGAETPDEIALTILAEVQAVFSNRNGGMLKDRVGSIHRRMIE